MISTVIWTLGEILQATNTNVYIASHTPISHRGRFNSLLPIVIGTGFAFGPPVMGKFIEIYSVEQVWPLIALVSLFSTGSLGLLYLIENRAKLRTPTA